MDILQYQICKVHLEEAAEYLHNAEFTNIPGENKEPRYIIKVWLEGMFDRTQLAPGAKRPQEKYEGSQNDIGGHTICNGDKASNCLDEVDLIYMSVNINALHHDQKDDPVPGELCELRITDAKHALRVNRGPWLEFENGDWKKVVSKMLAHIYNHLDKYDANYGVNDTCLISTLMLRSDKKDHNH